MTVARFVLRALLAGVAMLAAGGAAGQGFPARPVRIVTADAGGGNDFVARLVQPGLTAGLGQPVVIENRSSIISAEAVSKVMTGSPVDDDQLPGTVPGASCAT
jgi:tripartite-type tricarboxylate transporter receptor subunit TctC